MLVGITGIMIKVLLLALCATSAATSVTVNTAGCNSEECDPNYTPNPNLMSAMFGYNIFKGNPMGPNQLKDPGFDNLEYIFVPTVKNSENRYTLDGVSTSTINSCGTSLRTEIISTTMDYQKFMQRTMTSQIEIATNLETDVSVSVPVKGAEVGVEATVPPLLSASFGSNRGFSQNQRFFTSKNGILVSAWAQCIIYTVKISQTAPPKFDPKFIAMLKELQAATTDGDETTQNAKLTKLINNFGTHYMRNVDMGARISRTKRYDRDEVMKATAEELKNCTTSGMNVLGLAGGETGTCNRNFESRDAGWLGDYRREYTTTFGSRPQRSLHDWANQDFDSPIPVGMILDPIVNLFTEVFMGNVEEETGSEKGAEKVEIDYEAILAWLLPKYRRYCEDNKSDLNIESCTSIDLQPKRCGFNDDCDFDQQCRHVDSKPAGYECVNPERTYQIKTVTSDHNYSGTDSGVWIRLADVNNRETDEFRLDNPNRDDLETGQSDIFEIKTSQRLGNLKKIILKTRQSGQNPGWHLGKVKVREALREREYEFPVHKWLYTGTYAFYESSHQSEWNSKKKKKKNEEKKEEKKGELKKKKKKLRKAKPQ